MSNSSYIILLSLSSISFRYPLILETRKLIFYSLVILSNSWLYFSCSSSSFNLLISNSNFLESKPSYLLKPSAACFKASYFYSCNFLAWSSISYFNLLIIAEYFSSIVSIELDCFSIFISFCRDYCI